MGKDKYIRMENNGWKLKAILFDAPGKDICVSISLNVNLSYPQVQAKVKEIKEAIQEWFDSSRTLDPSHFICDVKSPYYSHYRVRNMVFAIDISVMTRKEIIGKGKECTFEIVFGPEIKRLIEELGLS